MAERQLHLFEPARPLLERFGAGFFRAVPPRPGVYIMGGEQERVLYIGQSRNLRVRLGSYKNARPDRAPRKVIRLVHAVRSIVWEECPTATAARLKENQLLRTHRPRFNRMNTWPRAYRFVQLRAEPGSLALALTSEPATGGKIFGAFKGTASMWTPLLRLLWAAWHQVPSSCELPVRIGGLNPPANCTFLSQRNVSSIACNEWVNAIESYFVGASEELLMQLEQTMPATRPPSIFAANSLKADLETLRAFYLRGPRRMQPLRGREAIEHPVVLQEEVDDWLVLADEQPRSITLPCK